MSDTTITAEERDFIRNNLEDLPFIDDGPLLVVRLLNAIEQAEASAEKSEAENARLQQRVNELLSEELTDGAVRERIQLRFNMHEVLQQNAQLTKERDWLAERCAVHCSDKCTDDANCSISHCLMQHCRHTTSEEWEEAARRAVAAGEE